MCCATWNSVYLYARIKLITYFHFTSLILRNSDLPFCDTCMVLPVCMQMHSTFFQLSVPRNTIPDCVLLTVELLEVCLLIKGVHMSHEVNEQSVPSYGAG